MPDLQKTIDEVSRYCDLRERLPLIPPSSKVRGIFIRSIEAVLTQADRLGPYRDLFPAVSALTWYPLPEMLVRVAVGGSILASPAEVHHGMHEIARRNAIAFSESLIGRALFRLLSKNPERLLQQGVAGRRQGFNNCGSWELSFPRERTAVMTIQDEYLYLESYGIGAARGTFDAIGLPVKAEAVLETRFSGRHVLEW